MKQQMNTDKYRFLLLSEHYSFGFQLKFIRIYLCSSVANFLSFGEVKC